MFKSIREEDYLFVLMFLVHELNHEDKNWKPWTIQYQSIRTTDDFTTAICIKIELHTISLCIDYPT